jgi:quinol monooxygenase YgiN
MTFSPSARVSPATVILMPVFVAKPGQGASLERVLLSLQTASRGDEGCLDYSVYGDLNDNCRFVMHEEWASSELLAEHNLQAHVSDFLEQAEDLLLEPFTVTKMRAIAE